MLRREQLFLKKTSQNSAGVLLLHLLDNCQRDKYVAVKKKKKKFK